MTNMHSSNPHAQQAPRPDERGGKPGYIYQWMVEQITARIESGDLRPNTPLPAERRLAEEYGVSLGTARRATEILRDRGLLVTVRSKGTYVTDPQATHHH
jgi:DNA-binding GntR family transcriptional regulator